MRCCTPDLTIPQNKETMHLKQRLLMSTMLCGLAIFAGCSDAIEDYVTRFKIERHIKTVAYGKQLRDVDWDDGQGGRLKMRIPKKYISRTYKRTKEDPREMIVLSASYSEFKSNYEERDATTPKMLRITLVEKRNNTALYLKNIRRSAKRNVENRRFYVYPNNWGFDYYKPMTCLVDNDNMPARFLRRSEPHRDEYTPKDCWVTFQQEIFIPKSDLYVIKYSCTSLAQIPEGRGGCSAYTNYRGWGMQYVMRRSMIPEWKSVHEGILRFLDQFLITEQTNYQQQD